jgi:hypothetical protein
MKSFEGFAIRIGKLALYFSLLLVSTVAYLYLFANKFYGKIPQALGGGDPERVSLVVSSTSNYALRLARLFLAPMHKRNHSAHIFSLDIDDLFGLYTFPALRPRA